MKRLGIIAAILFVGTVWFANWLLARYGVIAIGPWRAPAGVLSVGVAFTLRDIVDRTLGKAVVIGCILAGCLLAYLIEANATIPGGQVSIAVASAIAFLFSEMADLLVYSRIEDRTFVGAVAVSNTVGAVADSAIFLALAFGSFSLISGQVAGKLLMTAAALPLVILLAPRLERA